MMKAMLAKVGEVEFTRTLDEAIALLETGREVDLILCDLGLPGGSGHELHGWISRNRPELLHHIGFVTGGACSPDAQSFLDRVGPPTLLKPFSRLELLEFTDTLLAKKGS
jgi:CheY-like chemotaxis protein